MKIKERELERMIGLVEESRNSLDTLMEEMDSIMDVLDNLLAALEEIR